MKRSLSPICYISAFLLTIVLSSCNKPIVLNNCGCGVSAQPILFDILDKNGNNIIHSVNDTLLVTYVLDNGVTVTNRLDILKVQVSTTNTTQVSTYNGFVISDFNPTISSVEEGYMSSLPVGVYSIQTHSIHNFKFYLNSALIGTVYFDYLQSEKLGLSAVSYPGFTLNGTPAKAGNITGVLKVGYPVNAYLPYYGSGSAVSTSFLYVLQLQN